MGGDGKMKDLSTPYGRINGFCEKNHIFFLAEHQQHSE